MGEDRALGEGRWGAMSTISLMEQVGAGAGRWEGGEGQGPCSPPASWSEGAGGQSIRTPLLLEPPTGCA